LLNWTSSIKLANSSPKASETNVTPSGAYPGGFDCPTVYGLVQGYPDLNDHDQLRFDPMFGAVGVKESTRSLCPPGRQKYLE